MKTKIVKHLANEMQTPLQTALAELREARGIMPMHPADTKHPSWNVTVALENLETLEKILDLLR
jgi:hypothetical protein